MNKGRRLQQIFTRPTPHNTATLELIYWNEQSIYIPVGPQQEISHWKYNKETDCLIFYSPKKDRFEVPCSQLIGFCVYLISEERKQKPNDTWAVDPAEMYLYPFRGTRSQPAYVLIPPEAQEVSYYDHVHYAKTDECLKNRFSSSHCSYRY